MHNPKDQLSQLLIPLCFFMRLSREAYSKYLNNKIYLHALTIRKANRRISKLLSGKAAYIPADLEHDIVVLLNHYDVWFTQFRKHKKKLNPALKDEFVFYAVDDQTPFPKHVEEKIFEYTDRWRSQFKKQAQIADNDI